jgi:diguanylate cyclase (GGDEF)-like protein
MWFARLEAGLLDWSDLFSLPLIVLALFICAIGSFTVIALLRRTITAGPRQRWLWLCLISICFGADVWTTHFIAMLAYAPGFTIFYRTVPTIESIGIVIAGSLAPFATVLFLRPTTVRLVLAALTLGGSITAMHFTGMTAMEVCGQAQFDPLVDAVSFAVAALMSGFAIRAATSPESRLPMLNGTVCLITAICGLHFIAMAGYSIQPGPPLATHAADAIGVQGFLPAHVDLAIAIACMSGLLALGALVAVSVDWRIMAAQAREMEAHRYFARHDDLTGLPNRVYLRERLRELLPTPTTAPSFALLYLDLDRFKAVNDLYGHHIGDTVLLMTADRIRPMIGPQDTIARIGGDEFIIVMRTEMPQLRAAEFADSLIAALEAPFTVDGRMLKTGASVGIAIFPTHATTPEDLMRFADTALYRAKAAGGGQFRMFEMMMSEQLIAQRQLERDFQEAIETEQFELHYQPLFDCATQRLYGFEALIRWRHPMRGMVSPADFIPYAEKSGMIKELGLWVLKTACVEAASWAIPLRISVNISPIQLQSFTLLPAVQDILATSALDPARLELEITESAIMDNPEQAHAMLDTLKTYGLQLAIDDFGTGYSSLSYLQRFPFDRLKIDRSLIDNMVRDSGGLAIVRTIIGLGHSLHIDVLAEGVETDEQLEVLRDHRCDQIQGYLLGRPMPQSALRAFIENASDVPVAPYRKQALLF